MKIVLDTKAFPLSNAYMDTKLIHPMKGKTSYKIKGYPRHNIIFDYEDEIFVVLKDGEQIATCKTASAAKEIVKDKNNDDPPYTFSAAAL